MASQYDLPYTGNQVETLLGKVSELEAAMPEKVSDLQNDAGYITAADVPRLHVGARLEERCCRHVSLRIMEMHLMHDVHDGSVFQQCGGNLRDLGLGSERTA